MARPTPPVLLLHGLGMGHRMWEPQLPALNGAGYRTPAADMPGLAGAAEEGPFTLRGAAKAALRPLDESGSAHVCGLSLGATVALEIAQIAPDRVRSLVLSGAQARPPRLLFPLQRLMFFALPERPLLSAPANETAGPAPGLMPAAREDLARTGKPNLSKVLRAVANADYRETLLRVAAPTLVLCGEKDRPNLPASREIARTIPHARLEVVPDAGHVWNVEQPERFTRTLLDFVQGVDRGRP